MQIPISIYIYLFFFLFNVYILIYAFNEVLCFQLLPPLHGLRSSRAPESQDGALGAPTCSSTRWVGVHRCPPGRGRSGAAHSRSCRAPRAGLCYCGFFRMRPCLKS